MDTRKIAEEYRITHWGGVMQERKVSGLSVRAFCKNAGYHENTYYYWQRKLREVACLELAGTEKGKAGIRPYSFAEVTLPIQPVVTALTTEHHSALCIEGGGVRISACCDYPAEKLAMLLREVRQPC